MNTVEIPENHKTVFVLDHTPYFGISSDKIIDFVDCTTQPGLIPLNPISKSLWTCSSEAALEYSRIVWDIFSDKLILFSISDRTGTLLNDLDAKNQNVFQITKGFTFCGAPPRLNNITPESDYSIIHGFRGALDAVCQYSDLQRSFRDAPIRSKKDIPNPCRFICITSARDDKSLKNLETLFYKDFEIANRVAKNSDQLIPITHCNLLIINTHPLNANPSIIGHGPMEVYPLLTAEVIRVPSADAIGNKLLDLVVEHYHLASTTITGIPMKEEQNSGSSANYDVEMYHSNEVHKLLFLTKSINIQELCSPKPNNNYQTVTLKWCTPKGGSVVPSLDIGSTSKLYKVTPSDASSRPTNCLVSFIVNGRTVNLESPRVDGSKIVTHFLSGSSGEVFLHAINFGYDIFDDLPGMEEGIGSLVPDYRLNDFTAVLTQRLLTPLENRYLKERSESDNDMKLPFVQALEDVEREMKFWPLTESGNILSTMKDYTEPLLTLLRKEELTQEDVLRCKICIFKLALMDVRKKEGFAVPSVPKKTKIARKQEQFNSIWSELVAYIKAYIQSPIHESILRCVVDSRKKTEPTLLVEKVDLERSLKELEDERRHFPQRDTVIRVTTDSPLSPPMSQQTSNFVSPAIIPDSPPRQAELPKSVYQIWHEKTFTPECFFKIPPYAGVRNGYKITEEGGFYARPYPDLSSDSEDDMESDSKK